MRVSTKSYRKNRATSVRSSSRRSSLANILRWPTLLAILVSVSGWGFVFLVESLIAAPLVEYDVAWKKNGELRTVTVSIENLSRINRIEKLVIGLASREAEPGAFSNDGMQAVAPAAEGEKSNHGIASNGAEVQFAIMDLQPRRRFLLWASYAGTDTPELRLLNSGNPIYLKERNVLTWIAKYSVELVGIMTIVFFVVLVAMVFCQARAER